MTNTQMKFLEVETVVTELLDHSPTMAVDPDARKKVERLMTELYEAIVALEGRDITRVI